MEIVGGRDAALCFVCVAWIWAEALATTVPGSRNMEMDWTWGLIGGGGAKRDA